MIKHEIVNKIRPWQEPFFKYMVSGGKRGMEIAHRRWGKDEVTMRAVCQLAHQRVGSYWHCLPEYGQARKTLWDGVNPHTGKRRVLECFPPFLIDRMRESEMIINFKNGSTWQLIGSDKYNSVVGASTAGIVFSEWALANPAAWAYFQPIVAENDGFAFFITTPRGRNHAKTMFDMAVQNPNWFAEISSIKDTKALNEEQIEEVLTSYRGLFGSDEHAQAQFDQEYMCSFNAAILGAYYAPQMLAVRNEGRICDIEADLDRPVHTAWDIGVDDDTAIWWFQIVGTQIFVLDCYSNSGFGIDHYAEVLRRRSHTRGWIMGTNFVPHDAKVREWGSGGRSRVESMFLEGLKLGLVPNLGKADGRQAVRRTLPRCVFHPRCEYGITALEMHHTKWNQDLRIYAADEHKDWTVHLADAFRYLAVSWQERPEDPIKPKEIDWSGYTLLPGVTEVRDPTRIRL